MKWNLQRYRFRSLLFCLALTAMSTAGATQFKERAEQIAAYESRRDSLIDYYANRIVASDLASGGYMEIAANLYRKQNLKWVAARLDSLRARPRGDMFWMYQFATISYLGREILPTGLRGRMREMWRRYRPYRGDTENHWAMYYASLYLMAQMFPGESGERWFNGRSSQENLTEAREYLLTWMDLTTSLGQGEYDAPPYFGVFAAPMAMLYAWAEDPEINKRAEMMLEYLIADFAAENLNGLYVGAHSRVYPNDVMEQWRVASTGLAWLLFGQTPFLPRGEALILAISGYVPSEILYGIATDRSEPFVHRERKRTRHRIRFSDVKNAPVYKYSYICDDYALGSSQGGLLQPIQQHTWDLTWAVDDPRGLHNTLFTIHPYSSPYELGMYFPEQLGMITDIVVWSKKTYDSPDKWTGASPYEQVFQHQNTLIALYSLPEGVRFSHISGFFSKDLSVREEDKSGWIFARGGDALIAYFPLAPYEWIRDDDDNMRLHSTALKNGAVVQVASASDHTTMEDFRKAVRALPLRIQTESKPSVAFETLGGDKLVFTYDGTPTVNGRAVDYDAWPLFDGPFLQAEIGSRKLEMRYGKLRRLLDFTSGAIRDWVVQ